MIPKTTQDRIEADARKAALVVEYVEYDAGPLSSARMQSTSRIDPIQKEFYIKGAMAEAERNVTMTKLEAIAHLEFCMAHNKEFKKTWRDYIELCIIEVSEEAGISTWVDKDVLNKASERILRLFQADWWEAQGLK